LLTELTGRVLQNVWGELPVSSLLAGGIRGKKCLQFENIWEKNGEKIY